jgi:hypothetical protein
MPLSSSATSAVTEKNVIGLSVLFLALAAIFGALNGHKVKALRANVANAEAARRAVEGRRVTQQRDLKAKERLEREEKTRLRRQKTRRRRLKGNSRNCRKKKADLQTDWMQIRARSLRCKSGWKKRRKQPNRRKLLLSAPPPSNSRRNSMTPDVNSTARKKKKPSWPKKIQSAQERSAPPQEERKRREPGVRRTGVRGAVLAVNQAYNFVVLNLGARQGVEPNSEMLVLREGTLIGKIRISSVEPATAIGDMITGTLARGVQVQPGDTVIYAGTSP